MNKTFTFLDNDLRIVMVDGASWFVAADVCLILSLDNQAMAYRRLAADEKCYISRTDLGLPGGRPMVGISESGLYKLIMRSDKHTAQPFQEWVTREVLPAIRKTGGYLLNENVRETAHADERTEMPLPAAFQPPMTLSV